jgi:hypothetical protein
MNTPVKFTTTNNVGFVDDAPDLARLGPRPIKLLQNNSPEAMRGDPVYVPGAEGGDFLVPRGEEIALYKGITGIEAIFVGFEETFNEWPAVRGAGAVDRWTGTPQCPATRTGCLIKQRAARFACAPKATRSRRRSTVTR